MDAYLFLSLIRERISLCTNLVTVFTLLHHLAQ